ncbi:uncharacterized protein LOC144447573 [Glandiceps talaboti]
MSDIALKTTFEVVLKRFRSRYRGGDIMALVENEYTPDCTVMAPGKETKHGRQGAFEVITELKAAGVEDLAFRIIDVSGSMNEGEFMFGCVHFTFLGSDRSKKDEGNCINIYKKIVGTWYLYAVCFNTSNK